VPIRRVFMLYQMPNLTHNVATSRKEKPTHSLMQQEKTLTPESFTQLLRWISKDNESAGNEYEIIRNRLIRYFTIRGCYEADRLADETIDRVSMKVSSVSEAYVGDPANYFLNVASKIYLEWTRDPTTASEPFRFDPPEILKPEDKGEFACLDRCLDELSEESRSLIVTYYSTEGRTHVNERKRLAEELGITLGALHIRACRIRTKLTRCVMDRLKGEDGKVS
jgi:DNA-directed RNA polymerase specialized sigma24 family protein